MKVLVFSDTHLSSDIDEKKFNLLKDIISQADRVVINGDFWEGFLITFKDFLQSPWKNLFPLLKTKKAIYIHGNHDSSKFIDTKGTELFSDIQTTRYTLKMNGRTYIFEHGNRLMPFIDETQTSEEPPSKHMIAIADFIEKMLVKTFGVHYQRLTKKFNQEIKEKLKKELKPTELYVCGHTHSAEVDEKNQFINTGMIKHGLGQYLWIDDKGYTPQFVNYL